jgi:DNA-binding XRE family transcriptional regulator
MKAQLLKKDGKPEFAVLPIAEYRRLLQRLEELEETKDFRDYKRNPAESFPAEVVNRLLDGDNPVKVWREYRGLTQSQLAATTGVTVAHISQIESGKRECSVKLLRSLAGALVVDVEMLLSDDGIE